MSFHVGQRAVIVKSHRPGRIGQVATVSSELKYRKWYGYDDMPLVPMHDLDLAPEPDQPKNIPVTYPPSHLEPYRDDGDEATEWTAELQRLCGLRVPV